MRRAVRIGVATALALGLVGMLLEAQRTALRDTHFFTGYLLIGCVFFLAGYNLRKKVPTIAFGAAKVWTELHLFVGWTSIGLFAYHIGLHLPDSPFEWLTASLFVLVAGSGVWGLYWTKQIPKRLSAMQSEVVFERIPFLRTEMARRAFATVSASAESTDVIADMYREHLATFFEGPRQLTYYVRPTGRLRRHLQQMLFDLDRYLSPEERGMRDQLAGMIQKKDDLDYQYALQVRMKGWLFFHIGMTYSLIIVALLHALIAHAFRGI